MGRLAQWRRIARAHPALADALLAAVLCVLGAAAVLTLDVPWLDAAVVVLLLWFGVAVAVGDAAHHLDLIKTDAPTEPVPSLNRLDALVEEFGTGQPVRWTLAGQPRPLPSAVDVAAYRIIQESLTNAHKHAPGAAVAVRLRYDPEGVTIEVRDDGPARPEVVGTRERAENVGGVFSAGPRPDGGWLVRAELPAPEEEAE
ncbi:sensor histidine kinase [Micromonospora sp. RTP1Z1]|uniref:sensor histidine kinase n=1 Tax=Micromonospora sp. RTP1Z1 TaxID=2994043 RepID=UPI0029C8145D|nr:ATP-binding protein [Micromonospora sp. RTP1Z1]